MYVTSHVDEDIVRTTTYLCKALEINELVKKISRSFRPYRFESGRRYFQLIFLSKRISGCAINLIKKEDNLMVECWSPKPVVRVRVLVFLCSIRKIACLTGPLPVGLNWLFYSVINRTPI